MGLTVGTYWEEVEKTECGRFLESLTMEWLCLRSCYLAFARPGEGVALVSSSDEEELAVY